MLDDKKVGHGGLCQYFFFHDHVSFEIQFAFVPKGAVGQVVFTRSGANRRGVRNGLVVGPSFIPAGFRGFSFWIWHNLFIYYSVFNFFNFSHRGSMVSTLASVADE